MKKIFFAALMGTFALATTSCNKDATEIVDKTEYDVIILVEGYEKTSSGTYDYEDAEPLDKATITLVDYDKTCTTDSKGKATLTLQQGTYRVTVEKKGYKSSSNSESEDIYETTLEVYGNTFEDFQLYEK
jgi:uncharacterized membrane protein